MGPLIPSSATPASVPPPQVQETLQTARGFLTLPLPPPPPPAIVVRAPSFGVPKSAAKSATAFLDEPSDEDPDYTDGSKWETGR